MVYVEGNSVPQANHGVLEKLIASRHELAQVSCLFLSVAIFYLLLTLCFWWLMSDDGV